MPTTIGNHARYAHTPDCPVWCDGHMAADPDDLADQHTAFLPDIELLELRDARGRALRPHDSEVMVHAQLDANWLCPLIRLDTHSRDRHWVTVELTSGEARSLARQLVYLADKLDLP